MIRFIFAALLTVFTIQAQASFEQTDCASADKKISLKVRFIHSAPPDIKMWTIDGRDYNAYSSRDSQGEWISPQVVAETLTEAKILTSDSSLMAGATTYAYQVKLTYNKTATEAAVVSAWLICSTIGGL